MERLLPWISAVVIPVVILGYNAFEGTSVFKSLIGISGVETAIVERFTTQLTSPGRLIVDRTRDSVEFWSTWGLICDNVPRIGDAVPGLISRLAVNNATFVEHPTGEKTYLIPDDVPVCVMYGTMNDLYEVGLDQSQVVQVCTVRDLKDWQQDRQGAIGFWVDIIATGLSIMVGVLLECGRVRRRKTEDQKKIAGS